MVGLGRVELPTSPLSGVRSSQLSYRPIFRHISAGGAGRDRTGGLLSANQALSQLSYSPMAAPCRIQFVIESDTGGGKMNRGQLDAETTGPAHGRFS
jgi:hypothetical protein